MLLLTFLIAASVLFLQNVLFPSLCLLAFAPWLAIVIFECSQPKALWLALLSGALIDCLSNDPPGVHALNYTVITLLLFRIKFRLTNDHPLHLSLFTTLISFFSTLLQLFLLFLFDRRVPFAGQWAFGDLLFMPIVDGLYALVLIALPLLAYKKLHQWGTIYWIRIKQRLFPT